MDVVFSEERIKDTLSEAVPLLRMHYEEVAHYKDFPLDPDYPLYYKMEEAGLTKTFIARKAGAMVGYSVFFIKGHPHYNAMKVAQNDIIFIHPAHRGVGYALIKHCEEKLKSLGVSVITYHIKANKNWGGMAERIGYELMDLIYTKRIN